MFCTTTVHCSEVASLTSTCRCQQLNPPIPTVTTKKCLQILQISPGQQKSLHSENHWSSLIAALAFPSRRLVYYASEVYSTFPYFSAPTAPELTKTSVLDCYSSILVGFSASTLTSLQFTIKNYEVS